MKRMNEVFELPVRYVDVVSFTVNLTKSETEAVCNAINNVDALADKLEDLLKSVTSGKKDDSINNKIIAAARALEAYRGVK